MTTHPSHDLARQIRRLPIDASRPTGVPAVLAPHLLPIRRYKQRAPSGLSADRLEYEFLGALAYSGWSLRPALRDAINHTYQLDARSGSFKQAYTHLAAAGLWEQRHVTIAGHRAVLVRLTPKARDLLGQIGVPPVPSEWEQIEARHRGQSARQIRHTAAICVFTHQARRRGWTTEVCPPLLSNTPAEPDVAIQRDVERIFVEVQLWGGETWRHAQKFRNQHRLQGYAAVVAESPALAARLVREAQVAGVPTGRVVDLAALIDGDSPALWDQYWLSAAGTLQPWPDGPRATLAAPAG